MKLFIISLITIFVAGCSISKYLTDEQTEKVFEHNIDLSKNKIRQRLILFANEQFVSGKSVIQTDDDGLFAGNGIVTLKESTGLLGETLNITKMELTFIVKYSDNNYRVKWVVKNLSNDDGSYAKNTWGYYAKDVKETLDRKDKELFKYLSSDKSDF